MRDETALKRLRFAYRPRVGESSCGAFAAACHDQRLRSLVSGLKGGGLSNSQPEGMQIPSGDDIERIAYVMRTEASAVEAVAFARTGQRPQIMLGELEMPRSAFEFLHRRIGPITLQLEDWHRSAWLNVLLPYCTESLEALVHACPTCGPLGWYRTRGLRSCEVCGEVVPPSPSAGLSLDLADDYRDAASLMSRDAAAGATVVGTLPVALRGYSRTALVDVMVRVGIVSTLGRTERAFDDLKKRPADVLAATICSGMRMLRDWPHSIRAHVDTKTREMEDDVSAYQSMRIALSRMKGRSAESREISAMAFPTIDGRKADVFASGTRYYTASQTSDRLHASSKELKALRAATALRFEKLPSKIRLRARYDADDVDLLVALLGDARTPGSAAVALDVPTYAIDLMVSGGTLVAHDNPGVGALRGRQVMGSSVDYLVHRLQQMGRSSEAPQGYVTLNAALASHPGEKPWGAAVEALLAGTIAFHVREGRLSLRNVLVEKSSFPQFKIAGIKRSALCVTHVSIRDTREVFAAGHAELMAMLASAGADIVRLAYGKGILRSDLRRLVSDIVFTGEAAASTGRTGTRLHHEFVRLGIPRIHGGWSRNELAKLGLVRCIDEE